MAGRSEESGKTKWMMWLVGAVITVALFIATLNYAQIARMPDTYVRLERYKTDISEIKAYLIRIDQKMDR